MRQHGKAAAWINEIGPVSRFGEFLTNGTGKAHEGIEQTILFFFDVIADGHQVETGFLVGGNGKGLAAFDIFGEGDFGKDVLKLAQEGLKRVRQA